MTEEVHNEVSTAETATETPSEVSSRVAALRADLGSIATKTRTFAKDLGTDLRKVATACYGIAGAWMAQFRGKKAPETSEAA